MQSNRALAYQEAQWIDAHRDRVQDLALPGVPFTVKNTCAVRGYAPDKGCQGLANRPSEADATVVARLRAQGAVVGADQHAGAEYRLRNRQPVVRAHLQSVRSGAFAGQSHRKSARSNLPS
ncbi:amidase family protein [Burkholderia ubonensis]|uniref:amidase family protein n=1 Tax=Burkholderia ubonensis TaxID=101571 RepID=UPI0039F2296B